MPIEVEILDSKLQTLLQPQTGAMEQGRDKPHRPAEMGEDLVHFLPAEDDGHSMRKPRPGHLF